MPYAVAEPRNTKRLLLRAYQPADVDDYAEMQTDPQVVEFLPNWPLRTPEESAEHFQRRLNQDMLRRCGDFLAFAVVLPETGKVIGDVSLLLRSEDPVTVELAWLLNTQYRGNGFAREAVEELLDFAREKGIGEHYAVIAAENTASLHIAETLGIRIVLEDEDEEETV
jgi:RimJ/RimL family protein N-acetyltransferase